MKAPSSSVTLRPLLVVAVVCFGFSLQIAEAKVRPRVATFASVARGAEIGYVASDALRPAERAFLQQAREEIRVELRIAQLAMGKASNSDARAFAQQLVSDHRQMQDSLDALSRRKGLGSPEDEATVARGDLERLGEKSGAEFDRAFLRYTVQARENALKIFEQVLAEARDTDVRDLAGGYLPVVRDHLNKARELAKSLE